MYVYTLKEYRDKIVSAYFRLFVWTTRICRNVISPSLNSLGSRRVRLYWLFTWLLVYTRMATGTPIKVALAHYWAPGSSVRHIWYMCVFQILSFSYTSSYFLFFFILFYFISLIFYTNDFSLSFYLVVATHARRSRRRHHE